MRRPGFTILELLLVIALVLILGSMTTAFYSRFISSQSSREAQNKLYAALRSAQSNAMYYKDGSPWGIHNDESGITLFSGESWGTRNQSTDNSIVLPGNATVGGFTDIIFEPLTGATASQYSLTVQTALDSRVITINHEGGISK